MHCAWPITEWLMFELPGCEWTHGWVKLTNQAQWPLTQAVNLIHPNQSAHVMWFTHNAPLWKSSSEFTHLDVATQIAKFMGPTWGPPGSCRPQMGPMSVPWTFLLGKVAWDLWNRTIRSVPCMLMAILFHKEGFQLPLPSQCWDIIRYLYFYVS